MQHLKDNLVEFLVTTPIHGFRHLHEGRNAFEKFVWAIVLLASFTAACFMIHASILDAQRHPIITSFDTTEVQNVPFPAISIKSERAVSGNIEYPQTNPWGFAEKFLDLLYFYKPEDARSFNESKALRDKFGFVMEKALEQMSQSLIQMKDGWSLEQIEAYGTDNELIQMFADKIPEMGTQLAAISLANSTLYQETVAQLKDTLNEIFFKFEIDPYGYDQLVINREFVDKLESIIKEAGKFSV